MTKDNNMSPLNMEMIGSKVSRSNRMCEGREEVDLIKPCKEKLQLLLSCCQDVAQLVETLECHVQSSTPKEAPMVLEVQNTNSEMSLLREELRRSKLHNEELEVAKMSLEQKLIGMEEKIQALTAQLIVYKEDFDLERRDRERAQGRLMEFEQQLLCNQRPYESYMSRSMLEPCAASAQSSHRHQRHHHFLSDELIPRDVCDYYETDGVAEDNTETVERPAMTYTVTDSANERDFARDHDGICSSVELKAQSFNIHDFFPVADKTNSAKLSVFGREAVVERDTLCTDGVELPLPQSHVLTRGTSIASRPSKPLIMNQHQPQQDFFRPSSQSCWLEEDQAEPMRLNLYETDSPDLMSENGREDSQLMCPKCHMRFSCSDHLLLLDHLEEC